MCAVCVCMVEDHERKRLSTRWSCVIHMLVWSCVVGRVTQVVAYKFVTEDSIEARMHELQHRKQLMFEGTVDGSAVALSQLTSEDLKFLFTGN